MIGQINETMSPLEKMCEITKVVKKIIFRYDVGMWLIWWFLDRAGLF